MLRPLGLNHTLGFPAFLKQLGGILMYGLDFVFRATRRFGSILVVIFLLLNLVGYGCSSGDSSAPQQQEDTDTSPTTTAGASWYSWAMKQIAAGMLGYIGNHSIGWVLSAFGSGGDDSDVTKALSYMEGQLSQIETDLNTIELELNQIMAYFELATDKILSEIQYSEMTDAILYIDNQFTNVRLLAQNGVPGSDAAKKLAQTYADAFLSTGHDGIDQSIYDIYGIIMNVGNDPNGGALQAFTNVLVDKANDGQLLARYRSLESFFNSLITVQMRGALLMLEAYHHNDSTFPGNDSDRPEVGTSSGPAKDWYDDKFEPQIIEQVEEFLRCTERLVIADADLRTDVGIPVTEDMKFLPDDADTIFARADFIAAQVSPSRHQFGLVARAVGEPNTIEDYVELDGRPYAEWDDPEAPYPMDYNPLGVPPEKYRLHPVELWTHWPDGWTRAYMQWGWTTVDFHGTNVSDYYEFDSAGEVAVAKFGLSSRVSAGMSITVEFSDGHTWIDGSTDIVQVNDTMAPDSSGQYIYGHVTLPIRYRPTAWQRHTYHSDSYDSDYFDVTNDYDITSPQGPWVRLIAKLKKGTTNHQPSLFLESALALPIKNGLGRQQKVTASVYMEGDADGELLTHHDTLTYWFSDADGETDYWLLRDAQGFLYDHSLIYHYFDSGDYLPFHFRLRFDQPGDDWDWLKEGLSVGSRIWPRHVYLYF